MNGKGKKMKFIRIKMKSGEIFCTVYNEEQEDYIFNMVEDSKDKVFSLEGGIYCVTGDFDTSRLELRKSCIESISFPDYDELPEWVSNFEKSKSEGEVKGDSVKKRTSKTTKK